jgi:pyruvate formate lyase activating enzyme
VKEALFYRALPGAEIRCELCPHACLIKPGERGLCGVRENRDGKLISLVYAKPIAVHVDPIEKKPLFHVYPGSLAFSVGTVGCNLACAFCQNAEISQLPAQGTASIPGRQLQPAELVELALREGCRTVAYTYTEPTVFFEYALDTSVAAREQGLLNTFVTNGYISHAAVERIRPYLDACNVDLKSFSDEFYRSLTGGRLAPVLETLEHLRKAGVWIEVTTLLIPGLNDSDEELAKLTEYLSGKLGPDTPWHVSRFFPHYRMSSTPPTPLDRLRRAAALGKTAGLRYIYIGNTPGDEGEDTICPDCGETVIRRVGFRVMSNLLRDGSCPTCNLKIPGIGMGGA